MLVLWHPTVARIAEVLRRADDPEVLLKLSSPLKLWEIDDLNLSGLYVSLLLNCEEFQASGYALLRRLQRKHWAVALFHDTDDLATSSLEALETAIEVAQKFRIDIDFLLTLPSPRLLAPAATRIFEFLSNNGVRRVSFAYPLLLSFAGVKMGETASRSIFIEAFYDAWLASDRALIIDDLHHLSYKLKTAQIGHPEPLDVAFIDDQSSYRNVDGPVSALRNREEGADVMQSPCVRLCEYYRVCGGDMYGAKALFNGTLASSENPYCTLVAKPLFARALAP
ncbi:MAG TPA: hypothetical protein VIT23_12635 [Terrimicrobiaceae bacterium]